MRRVELALFFGRIDRKLLEEVFVNTTDQVFFLAKLLVADLVDLIDNLFDVVGRKVAGGKGTLDKAAFQLFRSGGKAVQCGVQRNIQVGTRRVDDGIPLCFRRQTVRSVVKGGVIKERRLDIFIVRVKPLCFQLVAQVCNAIFVFLADKAQKHKGKHHIAFFKERAGISRRAQIVPAVEQNPIQIQSFFFGLLFCHRVIPPGEM